MTKILNLDTRAHTSRVLSNWLADRPGGAARAGIVAAGENATATNNNLSADELLQAFSIGYPTASGANVTAASALRVSTVYRCVSIISDTIASMPLDVFERLAGRDRQPVTHDYWWMFNEQACDGWTSATAWQYVISSKLLHGDGFAELLRASPVSSRIVGWRPLHPHRVQPFLDADSVLRYRISPSNAAQYVLDSSDILHLPSLGFDGLTSPSPITYAARETIGTALAGEAHTAKFFSGGATFDYALKTTGTLKQPQIDELKLSLMSRYAGNSRAPLILTGGLEPAQLSVNSKDAEILATRMFGVEELCRIFGVPPQMVGAGEKTSGWAGSSIEQLGLGFVRYTLMPYLRPLQQELNRKLWPINPTYFVEHNTASLVAGDLAARTNAHRVAIGRAGEPGWMTVNEVRRTENMPPVEGGDTLAGAQASATPTGATNAP